MKPGHDDHDGRRRPSVPPWLRRVPALFVWAMSVWMVLTWSVMEEQLVAGGLISLTTALLIAPTGPVARPGLLLRPRTLYHGAALSASCLVRIVRANIALAGRIWNPRRPLESGMMIVPTTLRSDGGLAAVGLLTSLIVDNQLVDLDRRRSQLQFHAISVEGDPSRRRRRINGPLEHRLAVITGGDDD